MITIITIIIIIIIIIIIVILVIIIIIIINNINTTYNTNSNTNTPPARRSSVDSKARRHAAIEVWRSMLTDRSRKVSCRMI